MWKWLGAGHYGIFSGSKWREIVYPQIRDFILAAEKKSGTNKPIKAVKDTPAATKKVANTKEAAVSKKAVATPAKATAPKVVAKKAVAAKAPAKPVKAAAAKKVAVKKWCLRTQPQRSLASRVCRLKPRPKCRHWPQPY